MGPSLLLLGEISVILAHGANNSFFLFLGLLFDFGVCWYRDTGTHKDSYIEVLLELSSLLSFRLSSAGFGFL